jgi:pyrroline-5-carboxylate reductase
MMKPMSDPTTQAAGTKQTVALMGAGMMGEAVLAGLLGSGNSATTVLVAERRPDRADELVQRYGVAIASNTEAAAAGDLVLIIVKPQDVKPLLEEIAPVLKPEAIVVSLAAGQTTAELESALPEGIAVVRVMPNTPALVAQGMSALSAGRNCSPEQLGRAQELLAVVGSVVQVPEAYQDAVTAVSGSGPAYVFLVAEAMIEAGVLVGLPRATATELTVQTLYGAATMLRQTGIHPAMAREQVTSPGGTTAAGLRELENAGVRAAFMAAIEAARDRSQQLAAK